MMTFTIKEKSSQNVRIYSGVLRDEKNHFGLSHKPKAVL
jgi:hypothetical protein